MASGRERSAVGHDAKSFVDHVVFKNEGVPNIIEWATPKSISIVVVPL